MFVYLLVSDGFYKIGVTNNIDSRIKKLQCGNPHKIKLVSSCEIDKNEAFKTEYGMLTILSKFNVSGEWFELNQDHVNLIEETFRYLGTNDWSKVPETREKWSRVSVGNPDNGSWKEVDK